jgi:hypothetical protein
LIDLCHRDEAGFALTLPTTYSWFLQGARLRVPFHAPQGRRVNVLVLGAYFTHGPEAGRLDYQSWAVLPSCPRVARRSRARRPRSARPLMG